MDLGKGQLFIICMHLAHVKHGLVTGAIIAACAVLFSNLLLFMTERRLVVEQYVRAFLASAFWSEWSILV